MSIIDFNHVYLVIIEDYSRLLKALVFGIVFISAVVGAIDYSI